jgi:hypothetical protein
MTWNKPATWFSKEEPIKKSGTINDSEPKYGSPEGIDPTLFPENSINYTPGNYQGAGPFSDYEQLYIHNWLARHIIDFPIEDSFGVWRDWPDEYKKRMEKAEKDIKYKKHIIDGLTTADVYGGSLIVMFINNQPDMSKPLNLDAINKGDLLRIAVFDPLIIHKTDIEEIDPLSERYLEAQYYEIAGAVSNGKIHHSRCIELHGIELPKIQRRLLGSSYLSWGLSRLEPIKETVIDYMETDRAISKLLKRLSVIFVKEPGVSHARTTRAFHKIFAAVANVARSLSVHGIYYGDSKAEVGSINTTVAGVSDLTERKQENVSGAGEIAVTRLFGKAKAGMSGDTNDGDIRNYQGYLLKYRNRKLEALEVLEEVLIRSAIGSNPDDCIPDWCEISVHTETEKAEIKLKLAQAKKAEAEAVSLAKTDNKDVKDES